MDKEVISKYIEDNQIEINDIDTLGKEDSEIKSDLIFLADIYVKYFNEFGRVFRNCKIKEILQITQEKEIFLNLVKLSSYKSKNYEIFKTLNSRKLENYVSSKYTEIVSFYDLCKSIFG